MSANSSLSEGMSFEDFKKQVIEDYKIGFLSRMCSIEGRREVLTGKAKFGIFGDGKELPQLAMARAFRKGDFRSGYYRDQTFMMAIGEFTPKNLFSGIYAHPDIKYEPTSAGRQMGGHFATHSLDENSQWKDLTQQYNSSSDISTTAGQIPRLVGLAQASKIYRSLGQFQGSQNFSHNGDEIAWGTIGNASTSEGHFFEAINAAGVLQIPMILSVWDDEYGISVHAKHQTTKESISEVMRGFRTDEKGVGIEIFTVKAWDYPALRQTYERAAKIAREKHTPVLIHVKEVTQPQGHSTSGSHERYKSQQRLEWEREYDCMAQMRKWILQMRLIKEEELEEIEKQAKEEVRQARKQAWQDYQEPMRALKREMISILYNMERECKESKKIVELRNLLSEVENPSIRDVVKVAYKAQRLTPGEGEKQSVEELKKWIEKMEEEVNEKFHSKVYSESQQNPMLAEMVEPKYAHDSKEVDGRIILRDNFDKIFEKYPNVVAFGEDLGQIGDVNQGFEGLQEKYGEVRIADTGIREATIAGQGIGLAMRGLRPIAEIQYVDYVLYCIQTLSDDLASLHYRSFGKQKAPLIIRTRGHRLEGIWHSGSPMNAFLSLLRGIYILVPRNMTKAAGFYNTLLKGDQPAIVIECLNGYRLKEKMPENLGEFTTPIGKVEVVRQGKDITVVSYGSTLRIVQQAAEELMEEGIDVEVIDAQSLLPFDIDKDIVKSIKKTGRLMVIDEDMPGGATAYMLQQILEKQDAYRWLDSKPQTISAKGHRPAYANDGDYFSKPNAEEIFDRIYAVMHEAKPKDFPQY